MLRMAVGQSDDVDGVTAVRTAIDQCRQGLDGLAPQAGLLFATFDGWDPAMVAVIRAAFPGLRLIGSTSSAEMSSIVGYREDSVTLAVRGRYRLVPRGPVELKGKGSMETFYLLAPA